MTRELATTLELDKEHFIAAAIMIDDIEVKPSGYALSERFEALYTDFQEVGGGETNRKAVRDLLRNGKFRPSGRSKPAQEYLSRVFKENGRIDLINNVVDVNNFISLRYGIPLSVFDVDAIQGDVVTLRLGREDESYIFNATGQELDCRDLVVVCDARGPIGSPVKDSQATKVFPGASSILYVVYASEATTSTVALLEIAAEVGELMKEDCPEAVVHQPQLFV